MNGIVLNKAGTVYMTEAPPPYPGMGGELGMQQQSPLTQGFIQPQSPINPGFMPQQQQNGFMPQQQQNGFMPQQQQNGFMPQQQNGYYAPQQAAYPQQQAYPQQPMAATGIYPQQGAPAPGFYPPGQNGFAYANGNQAFVPSSAPPPYDFANKKND